jgi:endonuclease YncB( thermonuclease family)
MRADATVQRFKVFPAERGTKMTGVVSPLSGPQRSRRSRVVAAGGGGSCGMTVSKLVLGLALASAVAGVAAAQVRVMNPDTLELAGKAWRLWGVDAPEAKEVCDNAGRTWACGEEAARALHLYLIDRKIECVAKGLAPTDPPTAICTADGVDLSDWMARHGWARLADDSEDYKAAVEEAQRNKRGVWVGGATK